MWIGGDAIMLAFIMVAVWMWSRDDRASFGGWLEAARTSRFEEMVAGHAARAAAVPPVRGRAGDAPRPGAAGGEIDDDEHLAAYNAYLARLNSAAPDAERPRP
jgi:hypothetical protein